MAAHNAHAPSIGPPGELHPLAGAVAAAGWLWSTGLLLMRLHMILGYGVFQGGGGLDDFFRALLIVFHPTLFWVSFLAVAVGWMVARTWTARRWWIATGWVCGLWLTPALEIARQGWPGLPATFVEPIVLAFLTGSVVRDFVRLTMPRWRWPGGERVRSAACFATVAAAAAAMGAWWFWQSHVAYVDYQIGYFDFGHFARRVINTWRGAGFLQQTPGLPPFWDHFNPGLAALAPLWGIWSDVHLFFAVQAFCMAFPALLVYGIARRLGAGPAGAAGWALGWLAWPVVGQLNYNFSLGWHPVSAAIPLLLAAAYCLLSRRKWAALMLAAAACSFKEDVLITTTVLALGFALLAWLEKKQQDNDKIPHGGAENAEKRETHSEDNNRIRRGGLAALPRPWVSLIVAAGFMAATAAVFTFADFSTYQVARFDALGGTAREIAMSPFRKPQVFWGEVLQAASLYFLLILFLPFGLANAVCGWPVQLALAAPLGVLLFWQNPYAKCIAFQYVTCPIVVIALAAMIGARRSAAARAQPAAAMAVSGAGALAVALCMSLFFGALPSTPPTNTFHVAPDRRAAYDARCRQLDRLAALIDTPDAYVMASGRVAGHLLKVRRLESLSDFLRRREMLAKEAGPGKTADDLFEWVLLDKTDDAELGRQTLDDTAARFLAAGFVPVYDSDDIILLRRPASR